MLSVIAMRVSQISAWAECETYALKSPPRPAGRTNVAAWVGTGAHAIVAGLTPELVPPIGARLAYDAITPMWQHADIQAIAIARCARELLTAQGWTPIAHEEEVRRGDDLVGHLDIRAWHTDFGEAIIDLKTGQGIGAAWLQTGGYLWLSDGGKKWGGVLHVPRVAISKDVKGMLVFRSGEALKLAWQRNEARIRMVLDGSSPTYSPGIHCARCGVADCPVRVGERK